MMMPPNVRAPCEGCTQAGTAWRAYLACASTTQAAAHKGLDSVSETVRVPFSVHFKFIAGGDETQGIFK